MITAHLVAVFFVLADRGLKIFALNRLAGVKIEIIKGIFSFSLAKNENIAFSLPVSGTGLNILILLILGAVLWLIIKNCRKQGMEAVYLLFIFLGGISNLYDRLSYGFVIDYLDLSYFTVFNLADVMVTLGVLGLIITNFWPNRAESAKNSV